MSEIEFTDAELDLLRSVAHSHDTMAGYSIDDSNLGSVFLRLVDFECNTKYASYHEISSELNDRVEAYLMIHAHNVPVDNVGMIGMMSGAFSKYMPKEGIDKPIGKKKDD